MHSSITKTILLCITLLFAGNSYMSAQELSLCEYLWEELIKGEERKVYLITDSDGYVNVREQPALDAAVLSTLQSNFFVVEKSGEALSQWVRTELYNYPEPEYKYKLYTGYIHKSRLKEVSSQEVSEYLKCRKDLFTNEPIYPSFIPDKRYPHVIAYSSGNCELVVYDISASREIFYVCVPICAIPKVDGEIVYLHFEGSAFTYEEEARGPIADYRLRKKEDGTFEMPCTRFYPQIPYMSQQEIDEVVRDYKNRPGFFPLVIAACNGSREAREILLNPKNFLLDASIHYEYEDALWLLGLAETAADLKE